MMELRSRYFQDIPISRANLAHILFEVLGTGENVAPSNIGSYS
ncbi:hypothetical protein [Desulfobacter curvatus]|nr:hypothetical protein [Desulfobacter curvatus]